MSKCNKGNSHAEVLEIRVDENNYRIHGDRNKEVIRKSLEDNGAGRSIVVDNTGMTIGGAGVLEQAEALGIPKRIVETDGSELVVVVRKDISPDDPRRKAMAVADNASTDLSEWDIPRLQMDFDDEALAELGVDVPADIQEDAGDGSLENNYVISYELVFNNEEEQAEWFAFLKELKAHYPEKETISERIISAVREWMDGE